MKIEQFSVLGSEDSVVKAQNSRTKLIERRLLVLLWIFNWGYTSSKIIQALLGRKNSRYASSLVKQGWLKATKTESGNPKFYFTLSKKGLEEAERHATKLARYAEIVPHSVNKNLIRHNLMAQDLIAKAFRTDLVSKYLTERYIAENGDRFGIKRPDVALEFRSGQRVAGEVELSKKWNRELDFFILGIIRALSSGNEGESKYDRFMIFSDSPAIIEGYRTAMLTGKKVNLWKEGDGGRWVKEGQQSVPSWLLDKVDFTLIED